MALAGLIPLVILFIVVGVGSFIGYSIYTWSGELADRGRRKMEKKNVAFTKDGGLRVGVKELRDENYADKTQSVLVNVWNHAALPNYKSRLGWNSTQADPKSSSSSSSSSSSRPSASRHTSSSHHQTTTSSSSYSTTTSSSGRGPGLSAPAPPRASAGVGRRSASPVPGGWQ